MSLPLTRRIARTALLLAAGAAPVVGAAGVASAAGLESVPQLGALTAPDATVAAAGDTATETAAQAAPAATQAIPASPTDAATGLLGGLPTSGLTAGGLPTSGLPTGALGGLPGGLPLG
ncbi:ATP-binding protein [Streptomyces sp. NBC_00454]|uniref:ATP-binding protein n=1 Tax=Streptomyces sp. NBC_00454 TaxID=2975747 RepID=UPI0032532507